LVLVQGVESREGAPLRHKETAAKTLTCLHLKIQPSLIRWEKERKGGRRGHNRKRKRRRRWW